MTAKERYLATLRGERRDRVPVTPIFMAWAAHYIDKTYRDFYLDGEVLAEAQLAVTRAFDVDQISAISDPWRESSAYGMEFDYPEQSVGKPKARPINSKADVEMLSAFDVESCPRLVDRVEAIKTMAGRVGQTHSVLGWIEGPLAQYAALRGVQEAMLDLATEPQMYAQAAPIIVANALAFAKAQIAAGADTIGVGDAAASLVGPELYVRHVLPWEQKLIAGIHQAGALAKLHICGNIKDIVAEMAATGADVIDVDWMVPLDEARQAVGPDITLCGNFDPSAVLLRGTPEDVAEAARRCIADAGERFILMAGCEVPQGTPEANIRAFCPGAGCLIQEALKLD